MIVGAFCVASLVLMLLGALNLMRAQRTLKTKLAHLEETQRRAIDPQRLAAVSQRITRDVEAVAPLMDRARRSVSTIGLALRYCAVAVRIVRLLT
ncbi:MAG TPA: hypothetical protein VGG89_04155 [Candidatus Baltobacteraceae bacterium]